MPAAGFVSQAGFFGTSEATVSFDRSAGMDYRQVQSPAWREDLADFVGAFHEFAGQFHLVRDCPVRPPRRNKDLTGCIHGCSKPEFAQAGRLKDPVNEASEPECLQTIDHNQD